MDFAMMPPAHWHRELVAHFAPECPALRKTQVVGVRRLSAADQTRLCGNKPDVVAVANTPRFGEGENGFIDCTD
jgi:hypothetical protein